MGSISSKTDFVLAGENMGPAKLQKATDLGIKIISEEDFLGMIGWEANHIILNCKKSLSISKLISIGILINCELITLLIWKNTTDYSF